MSDTTFLVTYYAHPALLDICLDSIRKYHPDSEIIISRDESDDFAESDEILRKYGVTNAIMHNMRTGVWVDAAQGLARACKTDIGVFIEHDAYLLRPIDDVLATIGEYDLIGPEEVIPLPGLNRDSPGFVCQNFFIVNMKKLREIGIDKMRIDHGRLPYPSKNKESGHGVSQVMDKKRFLEVNPSGYAFGTYYGDVAHHLWYGSYPKRNIEYDNVNRLWIVEETERLIKDYWSNETNSIKN